MARSVALVAAAIVLLCAAGASASSRLLVESGTTGGRGLLQSAPNCTRVDAFCTQCRNQRIPGSRTSELVCSACASGYRLRRDGIFKTCDCAPGLFRNASGVCVACQRGQFCLGGDAQVNPTNAATSCPTGLATIFAGAKSQAQCFTVAGYGRVSARDSNGVVTLSAVQCPVGSYNSGGNTAGCQRCGLGLTTAGVGTANLTQCVAPAGSFQDRGTGKLCQKGTYTTALNSAAACTPCPAGVTTAGEGSTTAAACSLAVKGFYMANATHAAPCPLHTYKADESAATSCTACPFGWRTRATASDGLALCMAPPGFELVDGTAISACAVGFFKADWNRNNCTACGTGLITEGTGSVSRDACLVPAGWGLTQLTPVMVAAPCGSDKYGDDADRPAVASARCTPCPTDTFTLDTLSGAARVGLYTSEAACLVAAGWGMTTTAPQRCPVGTYNAGQNRLPCTPCATGLTTVADGRTSATQCVVQAGWRMGGDGIPAPCDKGTYSTGGTELAPNATCTACGTGLSTQDDAATEAGDCSVCAAGYGGAGCALCPYGTFSSGGAAAGEDCVPCATGTTSRRGATESNMCLSRLQEPTRDIFPLGTNAWAVDAASTSALACGTSCWANAACVMYRFASTGSVCEHFLETAGGAVSLGFKVGAADDYALHTIPTGQTVGVALGAAATVADEAACRASCTANSACELYSFASGSCTLLRSELDTDYSSMWAVRGADLLSDHGL